MGTKFKKGDKVVRIPTECGTTFIENKVYTIDECTEYEVSVLELKNKGKWFPKNFELAEPIEFLKKYAKPIPSKKEPELDRDIIKAYLEVQVKNQNWREVHKLARELFELDKKSKGNQ